MKEQSKETEQFSQTPVSVSAYKLDSIKIEFKKGYSFDKTKDRYEGLIKFSNGDSESFQFKIREDMAKPYIDLMANEIIKSANELGNRLIESLGLSLESH